MDSAQQVPGNIALDPYIRLALALIGHSRMVGGNMFRHSMATLAVLIDYKYFNPVLLKAAIIHDLIEEIPETNTEEIKRLDQDGEAVLQLVLQVTRRIGETKSDFLCRILETGTSEAKLLKISDRINNLIDINPMLQDPNFIRRYLQETEDFILPMAQQVNNDMVKEVTDLVNIRRRTLEQRMNN